MNSAPAVEWRDDECDPRWGEYLTDISGQAHERRLAAQLRVTRSKDAWTRVAVDFLHGRNDADQVGAALAELTAARQALRDLDAEAE